MYEYITGKLQSLTPTAAIVEAAGVGYFINISLQTHKEIEAKEQVKLLIHSYVLQQEATILYGFATPTERELFRLLISVSGIGANTARIMLSTYSPSELANMIATANVAAIQKTKGIGAKTAERVVLELKSKVLNVLSIDLDDTFTTPNLETPSSENLQEAISALMVLGFNKASTEKIARKIYNQNPTITPENLIREALTLL
ncbi:MAG: Holliday junction branch migration protein RuvA [Rikenellaceae bacterium]